MMSCFCGKKLTELDLDIMEENEENNVYPAAASDYKLLEEVGQGGSAIVYRALCLPFNEVVAIKRFDLDKCNISLDETLRQDRSLSLINHPNMVKAYCSFVVERSLWIVMPYMSRGSCLHIMRAAFTEGFEEPVIATILKETLKALEYLHRHLHIHRYVKAGNILIDASGTIKVGVFGPVAHISDMDNQQKSENAFVGTPCWVAPEVLEKGHSYDFKTDIWSFGITALELAHGHTPFLRCPPTKVLLTTSQNIPLGFDNERGKRFSKSFKEMITMCLVQEPTKRPTAEKLLKHSFFKGAKSSEYVARRILDGLPPLSEHVKTLKLADAARLAQKQMPYGDQQQTSQIHDNADAPACKEDNFLKSSSSKGSPNALQTVVKPAPQSAPDAGQHDLQLLVKASVMNAESVADASLKVFPKLLQTKVANGTTYISGEKEEKPVHVSELQGINENDSDREVLGDVEKKQDQEEQCSFPGDPLAANCTLASYGRDSEKGKEKNKLGKMGEDISQGRSNHQKRASSGPFNTMPGNEGPDHNLKETFVQKKGRFRVTSEDVELAEENHPVSSTRRAATTQALSKRTFTSQPASASNAGTVRTSTVMAQLKNILHQNALQQELYLSLICDLNPREVVATTQRQKYQASKGSCSFGRVAAEPSSKEQELLQQVAELQSRVSVLGDDLKLVKARNVQLERQLNAIYNKEEEERIRGEEAAEEM